jgi:hypothetical protein
MRRVQIRKPKRPTTARQALDRRKTEQAWVGRRPGAPMTEPQIPTDCCPGGRPRRGGSYPPSNRSCGPSTFDVGLLVEGTGYGGSPGDTFVPETYTYVSPRLRRLGRLGRLGRRAGGTWLATIISQAAAVVARQAKPVRSPNTASGLTGS